MRESHYSVIAQHRGQLGLLLNGRVECTCRAHLDNELEWAQHLTDALKGAGYVIVVANEEDHDPQ